MADDEGSALETAAKTEVEALHRFFQGWFRGDLPKDSGSLEPLERALDPAFEIISPRGVRNDRAQIIAAVRSARGTWTVEDSIWISDVRVLQRTAPLSVVTYEEWQRRAGVTRGRLSTAVFRDDPTAPHGFVWVHLHETWLDEPER